MEKEEEETSETLDILHEENACWVAEIMKLNSDFIRKVHIKWEGKSLLLVDPDAMPFVLHVHVHALNTRQK